MADRYWIVGGVYTDTSFTEIASGGVEERHGPYATADAARRKWAALSMAAVDDAHARYRVVREGGAEFWVVGGAYTDTDFRTIARGGAEERIGPFATYEKALEVWRSKAWATVDDGYVRYRIEQV